MNPDDKFFLMLVGMGLIFILTMVIIVYVST